MSKCCQRCYCCHYYSGCEECCAMASFRHCGIVYIRVKNKKGETIALQASYFSPLRGCSFEIRTNVGTIKAYGLPKECVTEYTTYGVFDDLEGKTICIADLLNKVFDFWVYSLPYPYDVTASNGSKFCSEDGGAIRSYPWARPEKEIEAFKEIRLAQEEAKKKEAEAKAEELRAKNKETEIKLAEAEEKRLLAQANKAREEQLKIKLEASKSRLIVEMNRTRSYILAASIAVSAIGAALLVANIGMMVPVLWWVFAAICACGICASIGCAIAFPKQYPTPEQIERGVTSKDDKQEQ